ncbi:YciI family protein [Streptomyces sp. NPDC005538]|uniref:YciI family protein n=1 Tax=unclassified Streptomyces TaxID=2593676 RepID=UPI0033A237C8
MLIVELAFTATSERLAARPAHRVFLQRLHDEGRLVAAGPWADDTGALLAFDTEREELERLLETDPYYRTPGVEVLSVREWAPVVGRGRLIHDHA